jgi:tetratricopeptide (TPR) repeat protein
MKARFGPDHPYTLSTLVHLARAHQVAGRRDEARRLFEQAAEKQAAKLGPDHPHTLSTMDYLARAYAVAGEPGRAEHLAREVLARQRQKRSPEATGVAARTLGEVLLKQTRYAEAEPFLRECLASRPDQKPDDWTGFHARSLLGSALVGQEKYAEAEALLVQAYKGMKQCAARIPPHLRTTRLTEALERLVHLYTTCGKPDEAARWRRELEGVQSLPRSATEANEP